MSPKTPRHVVDVLRATGDEATIWLACDCGASVAWRADDVDHGGDGPLIWTREVVGPQSLPSAYYHRPPRRRV